MNHDQQEVLTAQDKMGRQYRELEERLRGWLQGSINTAELEATLVIPTLMDLELKVPYFWSEEPALKERSDELRRQMYLLAEAASMVSVAIRRAQWLSGQGDPTPELRREGLRREFQTTVEDAQFFGDKCDRTERAYQLLVRTPQPSRG